MKKLLFIALGCFLVYNAGAQDKEDLKQKTFGKLTQADRLVFNIFTDIWINAPKDSIDIKNMNRGFDFYIMHELPFGKSNFAFAFGLGVGCHNLYSDAMPVKSYIDTNDVKNYDGTTVFKKIPAFSTDTRQMIDVKNNKFTQVYLDLPIEFRYRLKNNAFKVYLGGKIGVMLSNHTKYHGDDFTEKYPTGSIRVKEYDIANVETWRYGVTARIGWKWIQVYGYYSFSKLFKHDRGPDMYPISVGLTISPY